MGEEVDLAARSKKKDVEDFGVSGEWMFPNFVNGWVDMHLFY